MRVGIIGAGAAGLAAAYELGKHGHEAVVYERAPFLGGQASTFDVGGARLERGYHHLFTSDTDIVELIHEIGLGDRPLPFRVTFGASSNSYVVGPLDLIATAAVSRRRDGDVIPAAGVEVAWWPVRGRTFIGRLGVRRVPGDGASPVTLGATRSVCS